MTVGSRAVHAADAQTPALSSDREFWRARDRGISPIAMAIVIPLVFMLIFACIQTGLWFYARNVAARAAQVSVETARTYDGSAAAGQTAGYEYLSRNPGLDTPGVRVTRSGTETTVVVTGDMTRVAPLVPLPTIKVTSSGPTERLTG